MTNHELEKNEPLLTHLAVYLLLIRDEKLLLSRRYKTGWEDGMYTFIAGHVDRGETIRKAMIREGKEEARIVLAEDDLAVVHVMNRKSNRPYVDFFIKATSWKGEPTIIEPDRCDDMQWFPMSNLPTNTLPHVAQALEFIQNGIYFSEVGF
ncbi:NUDIX hydrolase [Candidatus Roizmanbacteria bacterium CG_4_9_14_0_2_um_filter_39_13]|uniref:NUDIX hydrolase n=2 Tax=Candidatus Roizmaniibacteriota TaxID=1752723 RepID=A0A2M8F1D6_9BACT|nr:MAG: NUDIX hydrolase [Candidatus Roizmanbacteria bacterium CG_4_10_14_0_2_um_filter_39_12]PJC33096.1 MAG: NUDIX hydrolase [Candidatus Roizmanbacteria bacterium CG_4_9_14_0_2_um_filter_39_13]PJE62004.1 MAG: NUDIX hydrolase [Candidatus Roizmanbacteria bacterium CG10_big_fil_rev_8_21_14_0_10_39_12]